MACTFFKLLISWLHFLVQYLVTFSSTTYIPIWHSIVTICVHFFCSLIQSYTLNRVTDRIKQSAVQVPLYNQRVWFIGFQKSFSVLKFFSQLKAERDAARRRVDKAGGPLAQASKLWTVV